MQQGVSTSFPNIVCSNLQNFSAIQQYSVIAKTFLQHNKTAAEIISTAVANQTLLTKYFQANCTAERNQTPHIFRIKAVMRPEGFNDLPLTDTRCLLSGVPPHSRQIYRAAPGPDLPVRQTPRRRKKPPTQPPDQPFFSTSSYATKSPFILIVRYY